MSINLESPTFDTDTDELWDVGAVINEKLAPALDGETIPKAIVSMLTFILLLIKPDIEPPEAEKAVRLISDYILDCVDMNDQTMKHEQRLMN